jgi:hypothetical protein
VQTQVVGLPIKDCDGSIMPLAGRILQLKAISEQRKTTRVSRAPDGEAGKPARVD